MNTIWSTYVQKIDTLYLTRKLRFDDRFKALYMDAFAIDGKASLLEIGAGPGALVQALHRWYPDMQITGSDKDEQFVEFARANAPDISFCEADATALPFPDASFDVTISHTVQEHVEPEKFFAEQYRVLKPGGVCLVLSVRQRIQILSDTVSQASDFERAMREKAKEYYAAGDKKYGVCRYPMSEAELPAEMAKYGFEDIRTRYSAINLTPDNADVEEAFALSMIEADRIVELDTLDCLMQIAPEAVSGTEMERWKAEMNRRYDERVRQYRRGEKLWDTYVSITMILRGVKR